MAACWDAEKQHMSAALSPQHSLLTTISIGIMDWTPLILSSSLHAGSQFCVSDLFIFERRGQVLEVGEQTDVLVVFPRTQQSRAWTPLEPELCL